MPRDTRRSGETPGGQRPRSDPASGALPVEELPPDTPSHALAAADEAPARTDADAAAHDPDAERSPRLVMQTYANALAVGDVATAAAMHADNAALFVEGEQVNGRAAIHRWHERLLAAGVVRAEPAGHGNDTGRLNVRGPDSRAVVVELAFDASGRIGSARWLHPETAATSQEERTRKNR